MLFACQARFIIYERAVKALPGSYKLWFPYLKERLSVLKMLRSDDSAVEVCFVTYLHVLIRL